MFRFRMTEAYWNGCMVEQFDMDNFTERYRRFIEIVIGAARETLA